jgi:hypothetical protein
MAVRTAAASALDTTVSTLKTQLSTYLALQQSTSPGDAPAKLFWVWLVGQLRGVNIEMAQVIDTMNRYDRSAWDETLSAIDPFT